MDSYQAVLDLVNRYSFTLDSGDLQGFTDLFAKAEWVFDGGEPAHGSQELFDRVVFRVILYPDGTPRTRHSSTNVNIVVDEQAGTATCERYVVVYQQTDVLPLQLIYSGHYFDEFARKDNQWHFTRCEIRHPFYGDISHHLRPQS
ncbi:nuclear transport factor 2 family protein [Spongorhabdus nitratireducens]